MTIASEATRRSARIAYLVGLGKRAQQISDEFGDMTVNSVYARVKELGLSFRTADADREMCKAFERRLAIAAARRGVTPDEIFDRVTKEIGACPYLIENILDDDKVDVPFEINGVRPS